MCGFAENPANPKSITFSDSFGVPGFTTIRFDGFRSR
jgi:hypothetical protein